ncbi:MAG TPA: ABC transporter permease [Steroidobacteraceae bacterium]|nr:ABC transporter permease [Steroidobacteraceae bacterium]
MSGSMTVLELRAEDGGMRLCLAGDWSAAALGGVDARLRDLPGHIAGPLVCDWSHAASPGIGPAWMLLKALERRAPQIRPTHTGDPPHFLNLLERLESPGEAAAVGPASHPTLEGSVGRVGRWAVDQGAEVRAVIGFFGRLIAVLGAAFRRPRALRIASVTRHVYETGITAIPIVSLIAFLISVIVAYLGAQQLRRFGAEIFTVDLVTISVLREMAVMLTAIIVAGRSGSAFAAEIGVMQLNEETDALRAMGMNPVEMLVVPRVVALVIALPLLTVIADAMGLAGGGLLSLVNLHIPLSQFTYRLRDALAPTTFWAGLVKAPIFAVLIGMVGTYRGMQVRDSARELGRLTTVAVVQAIFLVILADALFAILFVQLDF